MIKFKGFSLVEIALGMAVLSVIMLIIMTMLLSGMRSYYAQSFTQIRDEELLNTFNRVDQSIRLGLSFPGSRPGIAFTQGGSNLIIELCPINADGSRRLSGNTQNCNGSDYIYYEYDAPNKQLYEKIRPKGGGNQGNTESSRAGGKDRDEVIATNVMAVTFTKTCGNNTEIDMALTISKDIDGRIITKSMTRKMVAINAYTPTGGTC